MDLHDFFPFITAARIQTVFRTMGYPETVVDLLGCICTTATPREVWAGIEADPQMLQDAKVMHARSHLPQGTPSSPSLANLCAYRLGCLNGLANAVGAEYTVTPAISPALEVVISITTLNALQLTSRPSTEEGFEVNHRKTRTMRQGVQQHLAD